MVQSAGQFVADESSRQLKLRISNNRPVSASDLGELFSAMAGDYHKATGANLIVARLESGSIVAVLQEIIPYVKSAAEYADAVNHLVEFAKNIGEIVLLSLGGLVVTKKIFGAGGKIGSKTVEKLAKLAVSAGAELEIFAPGSPDPVLRIGPSDGRRIRKVARRNKKIKKDRALDNKDMFVADDMRTTIIEAVRRGDVGVTKLIQVFAQMLKKHGMGHLLLEMANELEFDGYVEAASLLRSAFRGNKGGGKAPLIET